MGGGRGRDDHLRDGSSLSKSPSRGDREEGLKRGSCHGGIEGLQNNEKRWYKFYGKPPCLRLEIQNNMVRRFSHFVKRNPARKVQNSNLVEMHFMRVEPNMISADSLK